MPEPCPDLQRTSGSRCCSEVCSGEEAAGHLLAVTATPRPALRGHRARLPPRGQPGKAGRGPLALTGLGRRVVPDGAAWRDDGLLRGAPRKTGQWHATRDAFTPPPSGGPGESRARAAPLSRRPPCPCGWCTWRRERGPVRGSGKDLLLSRAGPPTPAVGGGREGGGARVSLGTQARPGPTSSVLRGCSLLTFAGGFCTLACEGRWSKNGPRPRGHEPSD